MKNTDKIAVIGGGSWGTAVAQLIASNGNEVMLYLRDRELAGEINEKQVNTKYFPDFKLSERITAVTDLKTAVAENNIIFIAVPSFYFRKLIKKTSSYLTPDKIMVSLTKGLEIKTYFTMSKIIKDETCIKLTGVMSGPNLALEIMKKQPAATVIASKFDFVIKKISKLIASDRFMVFAQKDVIGVEIAGALKNVIAIASGIGDGMGLGINTTSFLVTMGINEIKYLALKLGSRPETFHGIAGIGDLMATSFSDSSRNYKFGRLIGMSRTPEDALNEINQTVEGYETTKVAYMFSKSIGIKMPILEAVYRILYKGENVGNVIKELLKIRKDFLWE